MKQFDTLEDMNEAIRNLAWHEKHGFIWYNQNTERYAITKSEDRGETIADLLITGYEYLHTVDWQVAMLYPITRKT